MSNFVEKIGEKLHMGGHKKEEEHGHGAAAGELHGQGGYEHGPGQHVGHGGYGEQGGAYSEHVGGLHGSGYEQHGSYGDGGVLHGGGYGEQGIAEPQYSHYGGVGAVGEPGYGHHVGGEHGTTAAETAGYGAHQAAAPNREGPLQKVKNKIKGKKNEGGDDDSSSSSSSESDGEGGRRKKKHGLF